MSEFLSNFHFIRPLWLLGVPLAIAAWWLANRQGDPLRGWRRVIDADLLKHLAEDGGRTRRPASLMLATWLLMLVAAAGPAWQRAPAPFGENDPALVVVLKATESMDASDLVPSRIERARQEIADLAEERPGLPLGLVTYAGSAHLVMPPTRDAALVASMASHIDQSIMPRPGDRLVEALGVAAEALESSPGGGSIVLLADAVGLEQTAELEQWRSKNRFAIAVLPLVAEGSDDGSLAAAARSLGAEVVTLTVSRDDTAGIVRLADRPPTGAASADDETRWQEGGYALVPLVALLVLMAFRRPRPPRVTTAVEGEESDTMPAAVSSAAGAASLIAVLLLAVASLGSASADQEAGAKSDSGGRQRSIFFTPDQLGQRLFREGRYREAAETFVDAQWQGMAWYRAGEFERAEQAFARLDTPEAHFNRGNALVFLGKYTDAADQYGKALAGRPDWTEAEENRELAEARAALVEQKGGDMGEQKIGADEIVFDAEKGEAGEDQPSVDVGAGEELDDKALQALWLRKVQTSPADFLRAKFSYQLAAPGGAESEGSGEGGDQE